MSTRENISLIARASSLLKENPAAIFLSELNCQNSRPYIIPEGLTNKEPSTIQFLATFGPPAKRHSNGVSLAGRWWPASIFLLGTSGNIATATERAADRIIEKQF